MSLGRHVGTRNHVLDEGQDRTNPFAAVMGDKMVMQSLAKLLYILVNFVIHWPVLPTSAHSINYKLSYKMAPTALFQPNTTIQCDQED